MKSSFGKSKIPVGEINLLSLHSFIHEGFKKDIKII